MMLNQTVELGVLDVGWIIHAKYKLLLSLSFLERSTVQEERILIHFKSLEITSFDSQRELKSPAKDLLSNSFLQSFNETGITTIWAAGFWSYPLPYIAMSKQVTPVCPTGMLGRCQDIVSGCFDTEPTVVIVDISTTQAAGCQERGKGLSEPPAGMPGRLGRWRMIASVYISSPPKYYFLLPSGTTVGAVIHWYGCR